MSHIFSEFTLVNHPVSVEQPPSSPTHSIPLLSFVFHLILNGAGKQSVIPKGLFEFNQKLPKKRLTPQINDGFGSRITARMITLHHTRNDSDLFL